MLGPFATASRRTPIHQVSLPVLSHAACASMSTTTTTTTTRDRGDRYGPIEWAQQILLIPVSIINSVKYNLYNNCRILKPQLPYNDIEVRTPFTLNHKKNAK